MTHPSRQVLRQRLRQLILMRETGPKRPAWHLRRMQLIWGLHDALAALDGGLTPEFPQTLLAYGAATHDECERQLAELCALPVADIDAINARAEWIARWGRQRNWELTRWKTPHTADSIAFTILGKGGPRIVLVGNHHTGDDAAAAGIVTALTAMAALEECGGLGDVGCITLLSAGDAAGRTRALHELCGRHTHVLVLGAHRDGAFAASDADAATVVLRACATALGMHSLAIAHAADIEPTAGGLPALRGFGPGPKRGIAPTIALLALVCARLGTPSYMENAHMDAQTLVRYLTPRLPAYLQELTELCGIECPSESKVGVDVAGAWVLNWAASRNWEVRQWPDASAGNTIALTLHGTGTARIILAAHLDTVYPVGIATERPVRIDGNMLYGPGSADNKSGLLSGLYAMAALQDLGALDTFAAITLICGGDEETDMRVSRQCFAELAPHHDLALVLEAGRENGDIVSARKGGGNFWFTVTGKAAHAGVEPHKGANAIVELAHHSIALHALNGMRPGATLNVGVVTGGTVSNSVPDQAQAKIDVRITDPADRQAVTDAVLAIGARTTVAGTSTVVSGGFTIPAMACTPQIAALVAVAKTAANDLGFSINDAHTGGMSYANFFAELGLPALDGLGPIGGNDHSPGEYILVDSIVPRTALLAMLMTRV